MNESMRRRETDPTHLPSHPSESTRMTAVGPTIERANFVATGLFAVTAALALLDNSFVRGVAVSIALILFAAGIVTFMWAYGVLAERSRTEALTLPGVFFLSQSVPKPKQRLFIIVELVQLAVAFGTAGLRPFTSVAFGILAPMVGIGLTALYGAKFGNFPQRPPADVPMRKNGGTSAPPRSSSTRERSSKNV